MTRTRGVLVAIPDVLDVCEFKHDAERFVLDERVSKRHPDLLVLVFDTEPGDPDPGVIPAPLPGEYTVLPVLRSPQPLSNLKVVDAPGHAHLVYFAISLSIRLRILIRHLQ